MADTTPSENGYDILGKVIGFIIIVFILGTILASYGIGVGTADFLRQSENGDNASGDEVVGDGFSLSNAIFSGTAKLGENVITRDTVTVHRDPAGRIVGEQDKREVGKVLEGPVNAQSTNWWRIDFDDAPDGWVDKSFISSKVKTFTALNIIPIIFENIRIFKWT
jgi:hypothetical protein